MEFEPLLEELPEEHDEDDEGVEQKLRLDLSQLSLKSLGASSVGGDDGFASWQQSKNAARRRGIRAETHPQRQSTPRRRLFEARMADQVFSSGGSGASAAPGVANNNSINNHAHVQEEVALALTPRLARSSSHMGFATSSHTSRSTGAARDNVYRFMNSRTMGRDCRETRSARSLPRETLECIAATARSVAEESLFAGARNVVAAFALGNSQSAVDLPTFAMSSPLGKMDSVREDVDEASSAGASVASSDSL
ncbi:Hypothetical Protein FCC1311_089982 [Hondaea fermentalgiana]|uniref:Uncharacterized protein n=1 Tax=Hondaea fermentalgiana TaxID=2315210 RepID=A0A2R5GVT0_9STRA|nr:Hypothetical Protein FCC1311_089982 [Hondaea fermentalgiana]|eukprot:GBG32773.1 Hypothetical Protein FCC1311_089982 [Hondaea fermentalgiana]